MNNEYLKYYIILILLAFPTGCSVKSLNESAEVLTPSEIGDNFIRLHPDTAAYPSEAKSYKWNYEQGLMLDAFYQLWKQSGDKKYYEYIKKNIDYYIEPDGSILTYKQSDLNLDNISPGRVLLHLYAETKNEKYKKASDLLRDQLANQPRTKSGGFWHKKIYPNQMWLDGLYMAEPFYVRYASEFGGRAAFDDVVKQFELIEANLKEANTGLYYHAWDESREQKWADSKTGRSPNYWGRSIGWFMMALVDVLDYIPQEHPGRSTLIRIFSDLSSSLIKYRDSKTGLWYQVVDQGDRTGNYIETSASLMYIYALAKGYRVGFLPAEYKDISVSCFHSVVYNFIKKGPDGNFYLQNTVSVGGLGGKPYRDGSYEYYISEPVRVNDFKGYGALLLAALEINKIN